MGNTNTHIGTKRRSGTVSLDLYESLSGYQSVEELYAATASIVKQLGFEHFIYGVRVNLSLTRPYQFVLSGYPKEWRTHYIETGYEDIDPTVHHCIKDRRVTPIIWGNQVFRNQTAAKLEGEAKEFGLANGASFPVQGRNGEAAMLSLATPRASRQAKHDILETLGHAQLLACYLHEAIQRVVLAKEVIPLQKIKLTDRERECLLWAAEGKTSWEIANIIHVSERTVTFHLQNVTRKMGVSTRQHAVARALSLGLISP
jgi:DNA-binding CsgD family transcriptional regulator